MEDQLILVDTQDNEIGSCGKLEAHEKALLHRAFSIFIFRKLLIDNRDGTRTFKHQLLVQKRAKGKYHSAGLIANSCCSHPRFGETLSEATARRLKEETGIDISDCTNYEEVKFKPAATKKIGHMESESEQTSSPRELTSLEVRNMPNPLDKKGAFVYKAEFDNGLTEHEFDHVFVGWLKEVAYLEEPSAREDWTGRNPEEAEEMFFVDLDWIMKDVLLNTYKYAAWFMPALMIATEGSGFEELNRESIDRIIY